MSHASHGGLNVERKCVVGAGGNRDQRGIGPSQSQRPVGAIPAQAHHRAASRIPHGLSRIHRIALVVVQGQVEKRHLQGQLEVLGSPSGDGERVAGQHHLLGACLGRSVDESAQNTDLVLDGGGARAGEQPPHIAARSRVHQDADSGHSSMLTASVQLMVIVVSIRPMVVIRRHSQFSVHDDVRSFLGLVARCVLLWATGSEEVSPCAGPKCC